MSLSVAAIAIAPAVARAEGAEEGGAASGAQFDRPHTIAELEAGAIALPNAPISPSQRSSDPVFKSGDFTLQTGLHLLFRGGRDWALGAGVLFAPSPSSDSEYGGLRGLKRTHSRSYMSLGTEGRYIPVHENLRVLNTKLAVEAWVGLTAGLVIIADRFVTDEGDNVPTILGTREVTVRSEGFSVGVQAGFSWLFAESWVAGFALRLDRWLLPSSAHCSPIGDCATLTGTVVAAEAGLTIGYRIPL